MSPAFETFRNKDNPSESDGRTEEAWDLVTQIDALEDLAPLFDSPLWEFFAGWIRGEEQQAVEGLISGGPLSDVTRGKIQALRMVRERPAKIRSDIRALRERLAGLEGEGEADGEG